MPSLFSHLSKAVASAVSAPEALGQDARPFHLCSARLSGTALHPRATELTGGVGALALQRWALEGVGSVWEHWQGSQKAWL